MANLEIKSDADIDQWIANHERAGKTRSTLYQELIVDRNRRHGKGLDLATSIAALTRSAKEKRYISYGDLAAANGLTWSKARLRMNGKHGHMDDLLAYCHSHEMPLLTAIVVGRDHLDSGEMDDETINGFVAGSRRLGVSVSEPVAFLKQCQSECFEWAARQADAPDVADTVEE
ncbi:hypothetical protein [Hoeflea sp. AS16]|uniref:hypothetical protein n=1 Tax=Hoeflea sp. AS16 TaxID=3135779 RepID=UPI00316ECC61